MPAINQKQVLKQLQKLSPQQIQMIKLLELPTLQLEQRVKQEIEENPVLEEEQQTAEESTEDNGMPKEVSMEGGAVRGNEHARVPDGTALLP